MLYSRTELLLGPAAISMLRAARVAVFGLGGVGSHAAEALVRAGIGAIDLIDADTVNTTNLNRQLPALHSTIGRAKTDVLRERFHDINPDCAITTHHVFYDAATAPQFDFKIFSFIIDAIDSLDSKILLIETALASGTPIVSSMGAGNKLDPTKFRIADISTTHTCPLARALRRRLPKHFHFPVVFSTEQSLTTNSATIGSVPYVPPVAGYILASEVVKYLSTKNS